MASRVAIMRTLKANWEAAPKGQKKMTALNNYETAKLQNIARIEKAATTYFKKKKK